MYNRNYCISITRYNRNGAGIPPGTIVSIGCEGVLGLPLSTQKTRFPAAFTRGTEGSQWTPSSDYWIS
ncbi:MAG: hypothetical protein J6W90_01585 [Verrucomicrobia bacterium]|nr:hypothetical protein [Verrucomicrobiota bacterium]MBP5760054.1 hypothetical protein [Verrucomicrobiota bacterium]